MRLSIFYILTLVSAGANKIAPDTIVRVIPVLNEDILELITGYADDETTFTLSHASTTLRNQTQARINQYKIQALKRNCPSQFNYLTENGNVLFVNSLKPAVRTYESLVFRDTKEDIISVLHQRRRCIQSMHTAKDLIADRLDEITIALPPIHVSHRQALNLFFGFDADIVIGIDRYFASIKLLVETGLVKKIRIQSALNGHSTLDPRVEEKLYQFLLLVKVPVLSFYIHIKNEAAFNRFAVRATFLKDLYFRKHATSFILPTSIETLVNANPAVQNWSKYHLPNLKSITVYGQALPDLTRISPKLESLTITHMRSDESFMESVCSKNNHQLTELSLGITSDHIDTNRLKYCLMALKPQLQKFAFISSFTMKGFWNQFAIEFLQDNTALKEFSAEFRSQNQIFDDNIVHATDVTFLNGTYNQLNLTHFTMSGDIQIDLMESTSLFIRRQTFLTNINIHSRIPIDNILHLQPIFQSIAETESAKEINLSYAVLLKESAIKAYLKKFVATCSLLKGRSIVLNGISIESVIQDIGGGLDESFVWKQINGGEGQDEESVMLLIATEKYQHEFR